ncbi:MAG TPA: hypothetical protein VHB21_12405 [Minicystis sp.]|nr:hypothetical protein [Minicystis sp.]
MLTFDSAALERLVARATGAAPGSVEPLTGGASTRRYLRVRDRDGGALVAMFVPDAAPEEATTAAASAPARWPFLEVRDLLAARGVRVPRVVAEDCDAGLLVAVSLSSS